jgi:hypothetical protein
MITAGSVKYKGRQRLQKNVEREEAGVNKITSHGHETAQKKSLFKETRRRGSIESSNRNLKFHSRFRLS